MLVREIIEKLQVLPQNTNIKICDTKKFKSDFKIENGKIVLPLGITGYEVIKEIKPITNPTKGKYTMDLWNSSSNPTSALIGILVINCNIPINLFIFITSLS